MRIDTTNGMLLEAEPGSEYERWALGQLFLMLHEWGNDIAEMSGEYRRDYQPISVMGGSVEMIEGDIIANADKVLINHAPPPPPPPPKHEWIMGVRCELVSCEEFI